MFVQKTLVIEGIPFKPVRPRMMITEQLPGGTAQKWKLIGVGESVMSAVCLRHPETKTEKVVHLPAASLSIPPEVYRLVDRVRAKAALRYKS